MNDNVRLLYDGWINHYVDRQGGDIYRKCEEATEEMAAAFPELTRVRGHMWVAGRQRPHWWLKTATGEIVDPTASQFPFPLGEYEEHDESSPEPIGKCLNCGEYVYDPMCYPCCSSRCYAEAAAELNDRG